MMLRDVLRLDELMAMSADDVAAIYVARRADGLTLQEVDAFEERLRADPGGARALARAERAWRAFDEPDGHELLEALSERALERPVRESGFHRWGAAAAVLVAVTLGAILWRTPEGGRKVELAEMTRYAAPAGKTRSFTLPDGSRMTLDAGSLAVGREQAPGRAIELREGRALFDIKPDSRHPFVVDAGSNRVVVSGTRFDVDLAHGPMRVTLFEGRVAVDDRTAVSRRVELKPGQTFVEAGRLDRILPGPAEAGSPAWSRGLIELDDQPLAEAAREMNRYGGPRLIVRDPGVAALRISGQFNAGDTERFAETLTEIHPVRLIRRDDQIELVPAG